MEMKFYRIAKSNIPKINISSEISNILIIDIPLKIAKYSNNREFFINSDPRQ